MLDPRKPGNQNAEMLPRVAIMTLVSVIVSVGFTAVSMYMFAGSDPDQTITVGKLWWIGMSISVIAPCIICPVLTFQITRLVWELGRARDELFGVTQKDPLTGLLNRRGFEAGAAKALAECLRTGAPITALMCDIDLFKSINDKYGHDFGDVALTRVASVIRATIGDRASVLARQGGEEFAVLLPGVPPHEGGAIAEDVRAACAAFPFQWESLHVSVTISIGVATETTDQVELRSLLNRADAALYQAKRDGRNRVVVAPTSANVLELASIAAPRRKPQARA